MYEVKTAWKIYAVSECIVSMLYESKTPGASVRERRLIMKKRHLSKVLAVALIVAMLLSACGQTKVNDKDQTVNKQESGEVSKDKEDYSDVELELFIFSPWTSSNMPPEEEDLVAQYLHDTFGGKWTLTPSQGDPVTELVTRMSSGNEPDVILFDSAANLDMFYEQGLLLEDWNEWADLIPNYLEAMGEQQRAYYSTSEGKLKSVTSRASGQAWAFMIRQDWLDNLGMDMPTTTDQLLDVMRAFTFDDPDGNGIDDTYGYTSAGGGAIGEVRRLLALFGNMKVYITDDGEVSHPIVDGSFKEYLDYAKIVIDEGLINPDWYTLGWDDRKPALYNGAYGICYYPAAALIDETVNGLGLTDQEEINAIADRWAVMDTCGGKGFAATAVRSDSISVSASAAEDTKKMELICAFLNSVAGFNDVTANVSLCVDNYAEGTAGYETDGSEYCYNWNTGEDTEMNDYINTYLGIKNWGQFANYNPNGSFSGVYEEMSYKEEKVIEMTTQINTMDKLASHYQLYSYDGTLNTTLEDLCNEFEIQYLMGEVTDYDGFVEDWIAAGGQQFIDEAEAQFKAYGFIE